MATVVERQGKDGQKSYLVRIRLKGRPSQIRTFHRKTDATAWIEATQSGLREGKYVSTAESRRRTVSDLIDRYIEDVLPNKKDQRNPERQLKWWKQRIGYARLADVTPGVLDDSKAELFRAKTRSGAKRSPASVVRYMAALSHAFTYAVKERHWVEDNPFRRVSRPKEPKGRVRYLSDDERKRLLKVCRASGHPLLYSAVVLSLSTGARKGELMGLQWKDVNVKAGRITLLDTKNGETRVLPLAKPALIIMRRLYRHRKDSVLWVFPGRGNRRPIDLQVPWQLALKEANIVDFRWHDLRHSAASYLAMGGATVSEIAEVLGHKQLEMVKRYAHLTPQHVAGVVERMNEKIFGR